MSLLVADKISSPSVLRGWLIEKLPGNRFATYISESDLSKYMEHFNSRVELVHGVGNMPMSDYWQAEKEKREVPELKHEFRTSKRGWFQLYELIKFVDIQNDKLVGRKLDRATVFQFVALEQKWRYMVVHDDWLAYKQFIERQEKAFAFQKEKKKIKKITNKVSDKLQKTAPLFFDEFIEDELQAALDKAKKPAPE